MKRNRGIMIVVLVLILVGIVVIAISKSVIRLNDDNNKVNSAISSLQSNESNETNETRQPILLSGAQAKTEAKLYKDTKPVVFIYKDDFLSMDDMDSIYSKIKIQSKFFAKCRLLRTENNKQISFQFYPSDKTWEKLPKENVNLLKNMAIKHEAKFCVGDGADFEYDEYNEKFLCNQESIKNNYFDLDITKEYIRFELYDKNTFEYKGLYLVPVDDIINNIKFKSIYEELNDKM